MADMYRGNRLPRQAAAVNVYFLVNTLSRGGFRPGLCAMQAAAKQGFKITRLDHAFHITSNVTAEKKALS